jgi:hypothetical protein
MMDIIARIESPMTKSLLEQHSYLHEVEVLPEVVRLVVGFSSEPTLKMFEVPQKMQLLQNAADGLFGKPCRITFTVGKPPEGARPVQAPSNQSNSLEVVSPSVAPMRTNAVPGVVQPVMPSAQQVALAPVGDNTELNDAKRYTQSLLGARIL